MIRFFSDHKLGAPRALFWSSIAFALTALAGAYVNYHYSLYTGDPVAPLSGVAVSVLTLLVAISVRLSGSRFFAVLFPGIGFFVLMLGLVSIVSPQIQPFQSDAPIWAQSLNLTMERNLPTFFSSYLLGLVGVMALVCLLTERDSGRETSHWDYLLWVPVALGFFFLGLDETKMIHERLNHALRRQMEIEALHGNYWTLIYLPLGLATLALFGRFLYRRFARNRKGLTYLVTGILLWLCVPILEVGGVTVFRPQHLYKLASTIEEMFEMWGSLAFLAAFTLYTTHRHALNR